MASRGKGSRKSKSRMTANSLWYPGRTATSHLEDVLGATVNLPLRYWQPNMLFSGAPDDRVHHLTDGRFPARLVQDKTHPIFSLQALPDQVGFRVCPCSSRRPWQTGRHRFIQNGCVLIRTGQQMDRDSYLVEEILFNIPADMAYRLRFRGQVPRECLKITGDHVFGADP